MKGLPIGYSKDLQEDKEALFDAEDTLRGSLDAVASWSAGWRSDRRGHGARRVRAAARHRRRRLLVAKGLPFRDAHEIVGALVRRLVGEERSFEALTLDEWRAHSPLFEPDVVDWVTPSASVARKRTPQSTHPDAVAARAQGRAAVAGYAQVTNPNAQRPAFDEHSRPKVARLDSPPQNLKVTPTEPRQKSNCPKLKPKSSVSVIVQRTEVADVAANPDVVGEEAGNAGADVEAKVVAVDVSKRSSASVDAGLDRPTPPET